MNPANNPSAPTITPNTLNVITGALNNNSYQPTLPQSHSQDPSYIPPPNNAASTAANGLFLLSQAHHELTKREEQARAGNASANSNPNNSTQSNGNCSSKRKSYDMSPPSRPSRGHTKRSRATTNGRGRKPSPKDLSDDDGEDDLEDDDAGDHDDDDAHNNNTKRATKKPETEEEKRKNFLERNRQGCLFLLAFIHFLILSLQLLSNVDNGRRHGLLVCKAKLSRLQARTNVSRKLSAIREMRLLG
jgi:ATF/CREB family transcription factor